MRNTGKLLSLLLALAMVFACMPQTVLHARSPDASGTFGDSLAWSFEADTGTLTVSGTGFMPEWQNSSDAPWFAFRNDIVTVNIESGVYDIGSFAFSGCSCLENVILPVTVYGIGYGAFSNCLSLTGITIPDSVHTIDDSAFYHCPSLESVTIPGYVDSIGDLAFYRCDSLASVTIDPGVDRIGESAFENCGLTSVSIPASVTEIGPHAFGYYYDPDTGEDLKYTSFAFTITGYAGTAAKAYANENGFPFVELPDPYGVCGDNLTWQLDMDSGELTVSGTGDMWTWPEHSNPEWFNFRNNIKTVTIDHGVTSIGDYAFWQCSMTSVSIPASVSTIRPGAFSFCYALTDVTLPEGITAVSDELFLQCYSLESMTIPSSVTGIGKLAFDDCTGLKTVTVLNDSCQIYPHTRTMGKAGSTTICGYTGSTAESYANSYGYSFVPLDADPTAFTVCFDPNGGSGTMAEQVIPFDTYAYLTKNAFTRTGYSFSGWNTKANGTGEAISNGKRVKNLTTGASITLYAQWKANTYTVKYSANGGTGTMDPDQATYGTSFHLSPNAFARAGYVFSGWNTAAKGTGVPYADGQLVQDLAASGTKTLYAQWTGNPYTVKFNANGGTGTMANQSMTYGVSTPLTKNAFTRTGYAFNGWNTKANGTGDAYANGKAVSTLATGGTVTLYAQWRANTYTVRFNANGGTGTMAAQAMTYNVSTALTNNAFTRAGYTFSGWNTAAKGTGTAYANGATVKNLATGGIVTLYAQWTGGAYTVKFNANGGTGTMANQAMTYGVSTALSANAFTRTGYTFSGWNTKADGSGAAYANGKAVSNLATGGTVTLYAQWKPNTYSVKFYANGGTGTMAIQKLTYNVTAALTGNAFTRTGYAFSGWNTKADGSGAAYANGASVKNLAVSGTFALYAQWTGNPYTVKFNANGGTGTMANQAMTYGVSAPLTSNAFTRTGYTFSGWNTVANGTGTAYSNGKSVKNLAVSGTVILYAQWKPNTYSVRFYANGGTGTMAVQKLTYNVSAALTGNAFTRTGYTFNGWNTKADGSGTGYTDGKTVKNLAVSGVVNLYAQWKPNTYTVKFNANGGSGTMANQTMTYGVYAALHSNAFTRAGYTFNGWNTAADGSGTAYTNGKTVKNLAASGTVTLYAQWK